VARAYNLGNGQGYSVREVIDVVREVTGRDIAVETAPRRAGDPPVLVADAAPPAATSAGRHASPTCATSSPPPGPGTAPIRRGTACVRPAGPSDALM
jgi:hypothetical protein